MVYDFTRFANLEAGRAICPSRLRSDSGPGTQRCFRLLAGESSGRQGLGTERRRSMATSVDDRTSPILGRATVQTDVLQGKPTHIVTRQDLRLLVLPFIGRTLSCDGRTGESAETKDISMVVRIAEKNGLLCDTLRDKLRGLSAMRAVNYLNYSFDAGFEEIEMNGVKSSPTALMGDLPGLQTVLACEVAPLSFWGGPPGRRTWYEGSMLTMLVDHIMRAADAGNVGLLGRFLNLTI